MIVIHAHHAYPISSQVKQIPPSKYVLDYTIDYDSPLGKGNFSQVYRCVKNIEPCKYLAVKLLSVHSLRQQKIQHLIQAEIEMLRAVNHPNVIGCHDVCWNDSWCYIFNQYFSDGNFQEMLKKTNYVYESSMLTYIKDMVQGLTYLQRSRIIHRDIKPANIFLKDGKAVIADLGFSKFFNQPFYDLQIGSPPYMPPEALTKGYYCNKTDVWAFGVMLYQIFHGEGPYTKCIDMRQLVNKVCKPISIVNLRTDLSIQMKQLILSCLQTDYMKRPKFSQIKQSWYFRKLFDKNPYLQFLYRSPAKTFQENKQNLPSLSEKYNKNQFKSPTFDRINKLKTEIKRRKQQNVTLSSFSYLDNIKSAEKLNEVYQNLNQNNEIIQEINKISIFQTMRDQQNQIQDFTSIKLFSSQKLRNDQIEPSPNKYRQTSSSSIKFRQSSSSSKIKQYCHILKQSVNILNNSKINIRTSQQFKNHSIQPKRPLIKKSNENKKQIQWPQKYKFHRINNYNLQNRNHTIFRRQF